MYEERDLEKINNIRGEETCRNVSDNGYATFLIFNPPNEQTYYYKSYCYQRLAIKSRNEKLCDNVKVRRSIYFDGSGISNEACLKGVRQKNDKDQVERVKPETIHKIEKLEVSRDQDGGLKIKILPVGTCWGTYKITVSLFDDSEKLVGQIHEIEIHLSDRKDELDISASPKKLRELLGAQHHDTPYLLQVSLRLIRDDNGRLERSNLSKEQIENSVSRMIAL